MGNMSSPKALTLFLLLGIAYPASQFGWMRESRLETPLGPIQVLWAFAVGFGALGVFLSPKSSRLSRKLGVAILLVGYCVSGALWAMEPTAGAGLVAALLAAGLVLVAIWMVAFTGQVAFRLATPARAPLN